MKKLLLILNSIFLIAILSLPADSFSQGIGIGNTTPDVSAALDITNTSKGLLIPRMSTTRILAIPTPARGLLVYDSAANQLKVNVGTSSLPNWQSVANGSNNNVWSLTGNSGTNPANQFIGTTDNQPLQFRVNNLPAGVLDPLTGNIFLGLRAGQTNTTGFSNIAIGPDALKLNVTASNLVAIGDSALFHNSSGFSNTAIGSKTLFSNTTGGSNTATGFQSLFSNTTGISNTANGFRSLESNTSGSFNVAIGSGALFNNTTGNSNTATGVGALGSNTGGNSNTATGIGALGSNTGGNSNTAVGDRALTNNTTGNSNIGIGVSSLLLNNAGTDNTAVGIFAMGPNEAGNFNVAVGNNTLSNTTNAQFNTAVGYNAGRGFNLGFNNTLIGASSNVNQDGLFNCVALGESSRCTGNSQVRFGNTSTTSIGGIVGYSNLSDGRYKKNVQEAVKGIDFIMKLRPVTYQLDVTGINNKLHVNNSKEVNSQTKRSIAEQEQTVFSGFVAQEVEHAAITIGYNFSGLDKPKNENDMYGLRYADFVVPLVKAFQELNIKVEKLEKENELLKENTRQVERSEIPMQIGKQQQMMEAMKKRIDALEQQNKLLQQLLTNKN